ncbi:hypothetical protein ISF_05219 [Cordyceps fumosorosea ARSEF 2679]|uniref:Uncharacterized protein n=1 Tax=Cordyceps fumosorosea (strain ARSEF 2679) TaxID=1081104 RepID=A0A167V4C2_CORFA|nr:hypothetical protein ISF_05219 [Cordyceps fumosorosea ARSEF 2679]OAA62210.1 hypothetical protein ISF_05219 [Cordyceps fumosorosea ARSEF 2679]
MMGRPIEEVVYDQLFPRPKSSDPQNFQSFLQRSLIPEVRQETHAFYGHIDTQEAKYPGLDYEHPTHRMRLSRWPWHRRLFRAFDALGLTHFEILGLTKWEGTKWAKEKFEREHGFTISDTTDEGFPTWQEAADWERPAAAVAAVAAAAAAAAAASRSPSPSPLDSPSPSPSPSPISSGMSTPPFQPADEDEEDEDEESEDELESVGVELNARLRTQAARRNAGDRDAVLDEAWEEWLKTAIESGELAVVTEQMTESAPRRASSPSALPAALVPTGMLDLARAGQWIDIPEFLQPMLREVVRGEQAPTGLSSRNDPARPAADTPGALSRQLTAATPRFAVGYFDLPQDPPSSTTTNV